MKNNRTNNYCGLAVATLLLGGAGLAFSQTTNVDIQDFTADANGTGVEWGSSTAAWDGANGNPAGSLLLTLSFGGQSGGSQSDTPSTAYICIAGGNPWYQPQRIAFSQYKSLQFDIKWDNTSDITVDEFNDLSTWPTTLTNSLGQTVMQSWASAGYLSGSGAGFDIELCGGPDGQMGPSLTNIAIPAAAASGWAHVTIPIDSTMANLDGANGIVFHKWINNVWGIANPANASLWIDNVMLEGTAAPPPPPTVSLAPAQAGLNLIAGTGGANDRQNIRTTNALSANYSWIGQGSTPVSYSFTITNYPGASTPLFMINAFLIPAPYDRTAGTNGTVGAESAPDWNEATCIFMDFENYNDGSGDWRFRYKTNSAGGNGTYYSDVQADLRDYAGCLGTWTLTFVNNTNVTMTHNDTGVSTTFVFSPDKASWWADNSGNALPMYYYIGARWNGASPGLGCVLSHAAIQGAVNTLDDNFLADTGLDPTKWEIIAAYNPCIQFLPTTPTPVYWANWTLPANGYQLESSASISGPWKTGAEATLAFAGAVRTLVTANDLPSVNQGYFRAAKLSASQLQVLLPGETNAPGTATGKIGTPSPQTVGSIFDLTINACDASWNIVTSCQDAAALTSTDPGIWLQATATLANGTVTISQNTYFGSSGTWTITATDTTSTNVAPGVSTPITIP